MKTKIQEIEVEQLDKKQLLYINGSEEAVKIVVVVVVATAVILQQQLSDIRQAETIS